MRNHYKVIKIAATFLAGVLTLVPFFINAQSLAKAENKEEVLEGISEIKVETVDDRKAALLTIIDLTLLEIQDLENKLNAFKDLEGRYLDMRSSFLTQLENYTDYLNSIKELLTSSEFTLESIQKLAQELKDWRENEYAATVKNIVNFILSFQNQAILKIADARLGKISLDLKRFKAAKLLETGTLEPFLVKAGENLKKAGLLNDETMILLSTSTTPTIDSVKTVQELVWQSLNEVKLAYKLFFQMSAEVKKLLKL
mgnify:FL=1